MHMTSNVSCVVSVQNNSTLCGTVVRYNTVQYTVINRMTVLSPFYRILERGFQEYLDTHLRYFLFFLLTD